METSEVIDKVKKLLALSEDRAATQAEAETAMSMAAALMAKYNIDQAAIRGHSPSDVNAKVIWETRRKELYKYWCVNAAAILNGCTSWWAIRSIGTSYIICGPQESREAAELMANYLLRQIEKMYKSYLPKGLSVSDRAQYRRTFKYQCAVTLVRRAEDIVRKLKEDGMPEQQCTALVVAHHFDQQLAEIADWMGDQGYDIEIYETSHKIGSGTMDGSKAGKQIKIQPNLT